MWFEDRKISNVSKEQNQNDNNKEKRIPKNLVDVLFVNGQTLCYLSDLKEIAVDDIVEVEGKMEKKLGKVVEVKKSFKVPKFDMKWIVKVVDMTISGDFKLFGDMYLSNNAHFSPSVFSNLWTKRKYVESEIYGVGELRISLDKFEKEEMFDDELLLIKGKEIYKNDDVLYISCEKGKGKAFVNGSSLYEIDFEIEGNLITRLECDCPCMDNCKHEVALLYKLRELSKKIDLLNDKFVVCDKYVFSKILPHAKGNITIKV